jgi:hypothetical protein
MYKVGKCDDEIEGFVVPLAMFLQAFAIQYVISPLTQDFVEYLLSSICAIGEHGDLIYLLEFKVACSANLADSACIFMTGIPNFGEPSTFLLCHVHEAREADAVLVGDGLLDLPDSVPNKTTLNAGKLRKVTWTCW